MMLSQSIITTQYSLEENQQEGEDRQKKYVLGTLKGVGIETRKYAATIFVLQRPFSAFNADSMKGL